MTVLNKEYCLETLGLPAESFEWPERILQSGTGVLLRGLPDFIINKANQQGLFQGRIVVVKSTGGVEPDYANQDNVYTLRQQGIEAGQTVSETAVITAISRVLSAATDWEAVLLCASNPALSVVLSNTTEAGLVYVEEDVLAAPPQSFPAKLTAFLYERFRTLGGTPESGLSIVPTELLIHNGAILRGYVLKHAYANALSPAFIDWLEQCCDFCDSLVDRIVTGAPDAAIRADLWQKWGYKDTLCIDSEPFLLWAIEGSERALSRLSFAAAHTGVVLTNDITPFREQKLRLLNGGHTVSVALAYLMGLETVGDMMSHSLSARFVAEVLRQEILPTVAPLSPAAAAFAEAVIDRFKNPFIQHKLLSITLQQSMKMQARNVATFHRYVEKYEALPPLMTLGWAAFVVFSRPVKLENRQFFGRLSDDKGDRFYPINDDKAIFWLEHWQHAQIDSIGAAQYFLEKIMADTRIFGEKGFDVPDLAAAAAPYVYDILQKGAQAVLENALRLSLQD